MEHRSTIARSRACDRKRMQLLSLYAGLIGLLILALAFMLGSRRYTVEGESMEPSLREGDVLYYTGFQQYGYGDLVIFQGREAYGMIVKRVIGLPGDRIQVYSDGSVARNNVLLEESYIKPDELGNSAMREITVGEGKLFVMGDNRAESIDSRDARIGQITISSVHGKVEKIVRLEDGRIYN
ncbi:MAG: signal peptidase I [Eubacteriales bacterium]|nr:signal peptidase I [Eubacteriales bacterium]